MTTSEQDDHAETAGQSTDYVALYTEANPGSQPEANIPKAEGMAYGENPYRVFAKALADAGHAEHADGMVKIAEAAGKSEARKYDDIEKIKANAVEKLVHAFLDLQHDPTKEAEVFQSFPRKGDEPIAEVEAVAAIYKTSGVERPDSDKIKMHRNVNSARPIVAPDRFGTAITDTELGYSIAETHLRNADGTKQIIIGLRTDKYIDPTRA